MEMTTITTPERNLALDEAREKLEEQHRAKYDLVASSDSIWYSGGSLNVVTDDGGYSLTPTDQFEDGISDRLGIPRKYLRRMRDDAAEHGDFDLLDESVNHWLIRSDRNWFVRGFKLDGPGVARAFLSDRYGMIDHIDALFATLDGIASAGIGGIEVDAVDLSERRLRVKITAPSIRAAAPTFLRDYRSPWNGETGATNPIVYAGLVMTNSETGAGAFQIAPHVTILVCRNGMTRTVDALRRVHLGEKMDEGRIRWSDDTKRANIDLIKNQAADAVTTFLSEGYLNEVADELEAAGGVRLDHPVTALEEVASQMRYSEDEQERILGLFMRSGDTTAGGIVNAVTALAQRLDDPDRAAELEESAFDVLAAAVKVAS